MNRLIAEDDGLAVVRDAGHAPRGRSGSDHELAGCRERLFGPVVKSDLDTFPARQTRASLDPVDLVLAEQHLDAAGQTGHNLVLARVHDRHVEPHTGRIAARQAPLLRRLRDLQGVRMLEKRLRGNASPDEARAAERLLLLDDSHFHAELSGADRGNVAARAGANYDDVVLVCQLVSRSNLSLSLGTDDSVKEQGRRFTCASRWTAGQR